MIRISKTSHEYPLYQANRSKNQKMIKRGEADVTDMPKKSANLIKHRRTVEQFSRIGRPSQSIPATGRASWLPVNQTLFLTFSDEQFVAISPPMTKFSWSNPDFSINQDSSYASATFMARAHIAKPVP